MYKRLFIKVVLTMFLGSFLFLSCSDDDGPSAPTISLSTNEIEVTAEEEFTVSVNYSMDAQPGTIQITKLLDGTPSGTPQLVPVTSSTGTYSFKTSVSVEDSDSGIVKFNFTILDDAGKSAQTELVVLIDLTKRQLLLKYDWLLTDEIRQKTGESDINDVYTDDVYRFHEDGTYQKSIGAKSDDFGDHWFKHCTWDLDEETGVLKLHRTGAFADDAYDVMTITLITKEEFEADIVYYGLDIFNDILNPDVPYDAEEDYLKIMSPQAKGSSFDPYHPGPEDDVEGPSTTPCNESDFENN